VDKSSEMIFKPYVCDYEIRLDLGSVNSMYFSCGKRLLRCFTSAAVPKSTRRDKDVTFLLGFLETSNARY
jgi:hypothetical protein